MVDSKTRWGFFFFFPGGFLESTGGNMLQFVFRYLDRNKNWSLGESRGPEYFHSRKKELGEGAESIKRDIGRSDPLVSKNTIWKKILMAPLDLHFQTSFLNIPSIAELIRVISL